MSTTDKPSAAYVKAFWRLSVQAALEATIEFLDAVAEVLRSANSSSKKSA